MTFKEISAWISAAVTVAVYGYFLTRAPHAATVQAALGLYLQVVIVYLLAQIVLHIIAAVVHRPEQKDERDMLIAAKSSQYASFVLMTGMVAATFLLLGTGDLLHPMTGMPAGIFAAHTLVLTSAVAELLRFGAQIVYYRRGA